MKSREMGTMMMIVAISSRDCKFRCIREIHGTVVLSLTIDEPQQVRMYVK